MSNIEGNVFSFLYKMRNSDGSFKRYQGGLMSYPGGKTQAVYLLASMLPKEVDRVVSPFIGGGSFEIACANDMKIPVVGYDKHTELVIFYNEMLHNRGRLIENLSRLKCNEQVYDEIKKTLVSYLNKEITLSDEQIAYMFAFNFLLSYGPMFLGWFSGNFKKRGHYEKLLNRLNEWKCENLEVKNLEFKDSIPQHRDDFMYLDPPYYIGEGSTMHKECYYHHKGFDHILLSSLVKEHRGKFMMSYNDCEFIRDLYKDYRIVKASWRYTMQMGEKKIGKNRIARGQTDTSKESSEIIILNY